jgi:hypothetical protein
MRLAVLAVLPAAAFAQTASGLPSFEVASVKRSPPLAPNLQSLTVTMDDRPPASSPIGM